MDSMLVVCYSETGSACEVARQLHAEHGWPLGEVRDLHAGPGAAGSLRRLLDSAVLRRAPIAYDGPDPGDFRTVILVTSMHGGHLPPAMRTFLLDRREQLRRYAIVSILKTEEAASAVGEVTQLLGHAPIHNATFTAAEVADTGGGARISAFGEVLQPRRRLPETGGTLQAA